MGAVEGLTEFLPISSTGHMIITAKLLQIPQTERLKTLEVVSQLGAICAALFLFWREILSIFQNSLRLGKAKGKHLNVIHILISMLPAGLLGVLCSDFISNHLFGDTPVLLGIIWGAVLMLIADLFRKKATSLKLNDVTYKQSWLIGSFQSLSLWPGFSRLGSTMAGGLISGLNYKTAYQFSLILAIPMMLGASTVKLYKSWHLLSTNDLPFLLVSSLTAGIVAAIMIKPALRLVTRGGLVPFAVYRLVLAMIIWSLS